MSGANKRTRFLATALETVVGVTFTGWASEVRAAPLLPFGSNVQDLVSD
jgi:hypothetical protein